MMWLFILGGTFALALAGVVFLVTRVQKFKVIEKLSGDKKKKKFWLSFAVVSVFAVLISVCMGMINLLIVTIYLTLFWMISDGIVRLVGKHLKKVNECGFYLAGVLAVFVSTAYLSLGYYNAHHVIVNEYDISTEKDVEPIKIVLISDAHIGSTFDGEKFGKYIEKINTLRPDIVVIAGDLIDSDSKREEILKAVDSFSKLNTKYGTYFVFGNHDKSFYGAESQGGLSTKDFRTKLEKNGVIVLEDNVAELSNGYTIIGRRDKSDNKRLSIAELMQKVEKDSFVIDINHQPNDYQDESAANVDLVLSGHTHGGQLFLIREVGTWMGANDKTYGYQKIGNTNFIVSSGISDWAIDFKTGCKSEIAVINILPER